MPKPKPSRKPHPDPLPDIPAGFVRVDPNNAQRWEMVALKMLNDSNHTNLIPQTLWDRLSLTHELCGRAWGGNLHSRQVIAYIILDWAGESGVLL